MRLKPPITAEHALRQLSVSATLDWGPKDAAAMEDILQEVASYLAVVSALDIPDDTEPLFGEDIGRDLARDPAKVPS